MTIQLMLQLREPFFTENETLMAMENSPKPVPLLGGECDHEQGACVWCIRTWEQDHTLESVDVTSTDGSTHSFPCSWDDLQNWAADRAAVDPEGSEQ